MNEKALKWLKFVGIKTLKTMAETAIAVIGTNGVPEAIVAAILVCAITKALKKADKSL